MNEFEVIKKYFVPLTMGRGALDDDAAVLSVPAGQALVVTSDTLSAGTHFLASASPDDIAHKVLRVNLSDLAAMGAEPLSYQLNIAFSQKPDALWLERFTGALLADQEAFGIYCSGGDTTSTKGPLSISITALGLVPDGAAVTRSGARDGDAIVLTGPVGDAFIGLKILRPPHDSLPPNPLPAGERGQGYFIAQYYKPRPRTDLAEIIRSYARAAIDVSDGLVADLGHICRASGLAAEIKMCDEIFSKPAQKMIGEKQVRAEELLTGGDDYVLALAVAPEHVETLLKKAPGAFQIGCFKSGEPGVTVLDQSGQILPIKHTGWSHF